MLMNDPNTQKLQSENLEAEKLKPAQSKPQNREPRENNTPAMAGLAIAVVLLVVGLWLAHELKAASKMQDCVLSGRTNCNVIQP
jgi:type VI protein secretion system component VasF